MKVSRFSVSVQYDERLLYPVMLLVGIGVAMVYSASSAMSLQQFDSQYLFVKKQAIFSLAGIVLLIFCRRFPYRYYRVVAYPLLLTSIALLIATLIPGIGYEAGGAYRWVRIMGVSFQPSEFARFALVVYLAYSLCKKEDKIKDVTIGFLPHILVLGVFAIITLNQPDFGSILILGCITWIMMFVGGVRIKHLFLIIIGAVPFVCYFIITAEYRLSRVLSFWDPWKYPTNEGYQMIHSLMAFGSGGILGAGLGQGCQKLFYLPEPHTDFIFSVIGEELGLLGVLGIVALFAIILWRGISIAKNTQDLFGSYLALGLTVSIGLQVCINMGVALGLLPTKGLTLPFLSYGGTSLMMNMAVIGILMNIEASAHEHKRKT
jgi:cell division protein FtsW